MGRLAYFFAVSALIVSSAPIASHAAGASRLNANLVVIVNPNVAVDRLGRDELRLIFQTRRKTWPDGSIAIPFNLSTKSGLRRTFDSVVLKLEPSWVARYWIDRRIRGGDRPPRTVASTRLMVRVVGALSGAIGYVEPQAADATVKVVARLTNGEVVDP